MDHEYKSVIEAAFQESWKMVNAQDSGWKSAKATTLAYDVVDKVEWRPSPRRHPGLFGHRARIFRVSATLDGSVETVAALIRDVNNSAKWNSSVQAARIVRHLDRDVVVAYQMAASAKGYTFPRDFVLGLKFGLVDGCFVAGGCSVLYPSMSEDTDLMVRAHFYPGCVVVRPLPGQSRTCTIHWLMECDFGGWVPTCLFNLVAPLAQITVIDSIKRALSTINATETRK